VGDEYGIGRPTWAEVDLGALRGNLSVIRGLASERRIIAVIKADAYGHGAVPVGRVLEREGVDMLAVATVNEARVLREGGIRTPVLLLQGLHDEAESELLAPLNLVPLVGRADTLAQIEAAARRTGRPQSVHLKVDTGMGRLGLLPEEIGEALDALRACPHLELSGFATHLAEADNPASSVLHVQRRLFEALLGSVRAAGFRPGWIHADPSAGVIRGATSFATAVRPGLALFGADPTLEGGHPLEPVMTLLTRVIHAKDLPAGSRVGYGGTYVVPCRSRILTLPLGYADGLPRAAGGRVEVGLGHRRVPLVGRVSMDLATVDAGAGSDARVGDEVLIFGRRADSVLRVEKIAHATDTISYELLVRIGSRVPRIPKGGAWGG
jgi:alanine racemase